MLKSLQITGFRCFRELRVEPLTRVNLFVGMNNSGKTSILEAAEILATGVPEVLRSSLSRRKEFIEGSSRVELDPAHLFYGRQLLNDKAFELRDHVSGRFVNCSASIFVKDFRARAKNPLSVEAHISFGSDHFPELELRLSAFRGLKPFNPQSNWLANDDQATPARFLGTEQPDIGTLGQLWDSVALTPQESEVTDTLRLIEPSIDRIAFLSDRRRARNFFVRLSGSDRRIPLGSVGDGLKRLLSLALHLQSAKGGVLLVDEIDTGLHYTVLAKMWRLVIATAKRLDLQVLATTHSLDCLYALATVYQSDPELAAEVTVHRVEKDQPATVSYQPEEIAIAAEQRIEVR